MDVASRSYTMHEHNLTTFECNTQVSDEVKSHDGDSRLYNEYACLSPMLEY